MSNRSTDNLKCSLLLAALFALALWAVGCGILPHRAATASGAATSLKGHLAGGNTGFVIESWMWIGIAGLVAGAVLMVLMKNDRLPSALIAGGGTALGISLALKTVVPWLPWLFGAALVVGGLWLYARYHKQILKAFTGRK